LYPVTSFFGMDLIAWLQSMPRTCRLGDDVLLTAWAHHRGISVRRVNLPWFKIPFFWSASYGFDEMALSQTKSVDVNATLWLQGGWENANTHNYATCLNETGESDPILHRFRSYITKQV